jgi:osmoprotectant transport system permease protein
MLAEDIGPKWLHWPWVTDHVDDIREALTEHLELTLYAIGLGILVTAPLVVLCLRSRRFYGLALGVTGVIYTIPALALFGILFSITGFFSIWTSVIPLALYTLLILLRNTVTGFEGVPPDVREAATGMGYSRARRLLQVDLPLALPPIFVGLRIAVATTIGLVTVTALIGRGGLGALMIDGFNRAFRTPLTVGIVLTLALALVADLVLVGVFRLLTPWQRKARAR